MVALTSKPILPIEQHARALEVLQSPHLSFEDAADALGLTLEQLTAFVTSDDGLALIAGAELAAAVRVRAMAAAQLHTVVDALSMMLLSYASSARNVPTADSLRAQEFSETQRQNARRAGHLLFRLAHFSPRPLRAYEPRAKEAGGENGPADTHALKPAAPPQSGTKPLLRFVQADETPPSCAQAATKAAPSPSAEISAQARPTAPGGHLPNAPTTRGQRSGPSPSSTAPP